MKRIFVLGSINMDMVMYANQSPQEGETICGTNFFLNAGGKGANQAVAVQKNGGKLKYCACVGDDFFGVQLLKSIKLYGVSTEDVHVISGVTSGLAQITVIGGNNSIILFKGANGCLNKNIAEKFLEKADKGDILLIQLETDPKVVLFSLQKAKEKGMVTILNPAPAQNFQSEMLKYVDILVPNETEALFISEKSNILEAARSLSQYVQSLIITVGDRGCLYCHENEYLEYPCPSVKVVDTTAAGDTFCGAFASRLGLGFTIKEAIQYALSAASLAVTRKGAMQSIPSESEVTSDFVEKNT